MALKIILSLLVCLGIFALIAQKKTRQELPLIQAELNNESNNDVQLATNSLAQQKQKQWQEFQQEQNIATERDSSQMIQSLPSQMETPSQPTQNHNLDNSPKTLISPQIPSIAQENYMTLTPTATTNRLGNPIYELRLYVKGQLMAAYPTVTGRAETQQNNRDQGGSKAPLPDGIYEVAQSPIGGTDPEVGEQFLPVEPLFITGRSALGIHYDPSFNQTNGEDGTDGCIALTNQQDFAQVLSYIQRYQPQYLEVNLRS